MKGVLAAVETTGVRMFRVLPLAGLAILALGAVAGGAQAKMVTYEVDGQRYSYSTNNLQQTAAARRHMEAAKAAAAAKAKADAERAASPLTAVFGSQTQREAAQARAALEQARPGAATAVATPTPQNTAASASEESAKPAASPSGKLARRLPDAEPARDQASEKPVKTVGVTQPAPAQPVPAQPAAPKPGPARIKSVSYDAVSGIKTTFMMDGSIREEPFDGSALPSVASEVSDAASLTAFVEQVRPLAPIETTGSTWAAAGQDGSVRRTPARP